MMGVSLMNTIWSATHNPSYDYDANANSRFDQMMNNVSSESIIPVIYGRRKWAGNQLWHKAGSDGRSLTKDILVGEGTCEGVSDVKFNDLYVEGKYEYKKALKISYNGASPTATIASTYTHGLPRVLVLNEKTQSHIVSVGANDTEAVSFDEIASIVNSYQGWNCEVIVGGNNVFPIIPDLVDVKSVPYDVIAITIIQAKLPGCSVEFHNGGADQVPPDNFDTVGGYRRMAWLRCKMTISEQLQGNNPTVTYVVKGVKVLDTRTGVTEWSDNPAMCVRDFLLNKRYGISKFVPDMVLDEHSFKEVADYCDQLVNYIDTDGSIKTIRRYALNIILDQKRKATEHLEAMFATFGGFLVNNNGVISLRVENPETPSYHFTNDTIVENSVSIEQLSLDECPNQYKVGYFEEQQNWTQVKALINDTIDQQRKPIGKGKVVVKELTLDGCTNQNQALILGRLYRLKNKLCTLTASWKTTTFAMHLQCGDVVTLSYDKYDDDGNVLPVMVNEPWRIIEISEQDGVWSLKARQYNESIYKDVTETIVVKDYTPIANPLSDTIPDVSGLAMGTVYYRQKDGTIVSDVKVWWTQADYGFLRRYIVQYRETSQGLQWHTAGYSNDGNYVIHNALVGKYYDVRVVVENTIGRTSTGVEIGSLYITGKDEPPLDVQSFNAVVSEFDVSKATLTWSVNQEPDIKGYEIRLGNTWETATPIKNDIGSQYPTIIFENKYVYTMSNSGNYEFLIKAIDNSGGYSNDAIVASLTTKLEPGDVTSFVAFQNGTKVNFAWTKDNYDYTYEIREGATWDNSTLVQTGITGSSYQLEVDTETTKLYHIKAMNNIGRYSVNDIARRVTIKDLPSSNVVIQFDEMSLRNGYGENYAFTQDAFTYQNIEALTGNYGYDAFDNELWTDFVPQYTLTLKIEPFACFISPMMPLMKDNEPTAYFTKDFTFVNPMMPLVQGEAKEYSGWYASQERDLGTVISARLSTTFVSNQLSYNGIKVSLEYRISLDGVVWSQWENFVPHIETMRFVQFRTSFSTDYLSNPPKISAFKEGIDVPDATRSGNSEILIGGSFISYGYQFYTKPNPVVTALGVNVFAEVTKIDTSKFFVKIKDASTGQYTTGHVNWFVNGY